MPESLLHAALVTTTAPKATKPRVRRMRLRTPYCPQNGLAGRHTESGVPVTFTQQFVEQSEF
jgi:hypothetical protein